MARCPIAEARQHFNPSQVEVSSLGLPGGHVFKQGSVIQLLSSLSSKQVDFGTLKFGVKLKDYLDTPEKGKVYIPCNHKMCNLISLDSFELDTSISGKS